MMGVFDENLFTLERVKYALLAIIFVYLLRKLFQMVKKFAAVEKLGGAPYKFPLGTLYEHSSSVKHFEYIDKYTRKHSKEAIRIWIGPVSPIAILYQPEDIKNVIAQNGPKSKIVYRFVQPWLGDKSLLTLYGEEWRQMRTLLNPAFHKNLLKDYTDVITATTEDFIPKLLKFAEDPNKKVDMFGNFALLTLDVICRCAFSYESNCQKTDDPYAKGVVELESLIIKRVQKLLNMFDTFYYKSEEGKSFLSHVRLAHDSARKLIMKRKEELKGLTIKEITRNHRSTGRALLDFLDILLLSTDEEGNHLSDDEVLHQCNTFLFAGHDTTSTALTWLSYLLSHNQDCQDKCREEITNMFGTEKPTFENLDNIPYTSACIREALRMFPPIMGVARDLIAPLKLQNGVTLEKSTSVALNMYALHRNPHVWEDPDTFKPERFLGERRKDHKYTFMPFSVGNRTCIGNNFALNELRVVVCQMLRSVRILPVEGHVPMPHTQVVLRSSNGVFVRFQVKRPFLVFCIKPFE
eukprot:m.95799 g.95799  ORF g.95799 m.95799 type:complete len:522 (+) comp12446_c0_seq5:142-1707(+)